MYSLWSVEQLKGELRKRGATLRGRKADLVKRLESFDQNFNFGKPQDSCDTEDANLEMPSIDLYHDVNSTTLLPPLTRQHLHSYFNEFNKKPDIGLELYESRYLVVLRSCVAGDYTFIRALGKAAMKKLQYVINIKLHNSGNIENATCECVAGSGIDAHCKHVAMTLYATEHMVREKILIKHLAPTEQLQSFHVPKKIFTSTPIQSAKLATKRKIENVLFEPYPKEIKVGKYNEKFRNIILSKSGSTMPLKQLYEPANPYGVEFDHSYCGEGSMILINKMKLEKVDPETIKNIELQTRGQSTNDEWIKRRENLITASKFHTICHLKPTNQIKFASTMITQKKFFSRATNHGIINEKVALSQYCDKFDLEVNECGLHISLERPYLAASPDGLLGEETLIEIKCPYTMRNENITPITVPYLVMGNDGQLKLKELSPYYYQVQGQLYCSGRKYCNLIIYTFKDMKVVYVTRNDTFITGMLLTLDQFYFSFFKPALLNKIIYKNYLEIIKKT